MANDTNSMTNDTDSMANDTMFSSNDECKFPLTRGSRKPTAAEKNQLHKSFPSLNLADVNIYGEITTVYNCIAWSMGYTNKWINPPPSRAAFIAQYGVEKFSALPHVLDPHGFIDGWINSANVMTHGSRKCWHVPMGWTSKLGQYLLIEHSREGLINSLYGKVSVTFSDKAHLTDDISDKFNKLTAENYFTVAQKNIITEAVSKVDVSIKDKFVKTYGEWREACKTEFAFSSDTKDCEEATGFDKLVGLGKDVAPLYIDIMQNEKDFFALVPYDTVQTESLTISYNDQSEQERAVETIEAWLMNYPHDFKNDSDFDDDDIIINGTNSSRTYSAGTMPHSDVEELVLLLIAPTMLMIY